MNYSKDDLKTAYIDAASEFDRLPSRVEYNFNKWFSDFVPTENQSKSTLSDLFFDHVNTVNRLIEENKSSGFEYMIKHYLEQYNDLFAIYNKDNTNREIYVYRDENYNKCRIVLCPETDKDVIEFKVKQLNDVDESIFFSKNYIIIQKPINIHNFSIIQGIVDHGDITAAIFKAELEHM